MFHQKNPLFYMNYLKKYLFFLLFISTEFAAYAQVPRYKMWDKRFGAPDADLCNKIIQTADSGYIIAGSSQSDSALDKSQHNWNYTGFSADLWIVKTDAQGNIQWEKRFGTPMDERSISIIQTKDFGYLICSSAQADSSGDKTQNNWDTTLSSADFWILKIDALGNKQWDKRYGGTSGDGCAVVRQTNDGGYFLAGGSSSENLIGDKSQSPWYILNTNVRSLDYWVIKTDSIGNKQWDKRFGGTDSDMLIDAQITSDGGYILGGSSWSGIGGDKTQSNWDIAQFYVDYWIVKIDSNGNKQWDKRYGGIQNDQLAAINQTSDGGYILAGTSDSPISGDKSQNSHGLEDYWIIKINSIGTKIWDKSIGGSKDDHLSNMVITSDGGFLMAGDSYSPMSGNKSENNLFPNLSQGWLVKLSAVGQLQWEKTLLIPVSYFLFTDAVQTYDNCYTSISINWGGIGGYNSQASKGNADYWMVKFCQLPPQANFTTTTNTICDSTCINFTNLSNGGATYQWFFPGASPAYSTLQEPSNICYNQPGTYDVTLIVSNELGFDTLTFHNYISVKAPTIKPWISQNGDTLFAHPSYAHYAWFPATMPGDTLHYHLVYSPGLTYLSVNDSNGCGAFTTIQVNGLEKASSSTKIYNLLPNPTSGELLIQHNYKEPEMVLEIIDLLGNVKIKLPISNGSNVISIDLHELTNGMYFSCLRSANQTIGCKKLLLRK